MLIMTSLKMYPRQEQVRNYVGNATNLDDLLPMLKHLSFDAVKAFVTQQIEQESAKKLNKIYYNQLSIEDIPPSDVLQHILGFDGLYHPKAISKHCKALSEKNEMNHFSKLYEATSHNDSVANTLIVHPKRTHLNRIEISLGYRGPMSLEEALDSCGDGDRLLIHDGVYEQFFAPITIKTGVQLIGVGSNVIIKSEESRLINIKTNQKCIHFEKIRFLAGGGRQSLHGIMVRGQNDTVSVRDCAFVGFMNAIMVHPASLQCHLKLDRCSFNVTLTAVDIRKEANVNISNCSFKAHGLVSDLGYINPAHYHMIMIGVRGIGTRLNCIRNTFEDCVSHPIVERLYRGRNVMRRPVDGDESGNYQLKGNVLKGNNRYNEQTFDPNTMYRSYPYRP